MVRPQQQEPEETAEPGSTDGSASGDETPDPPATVTQPAVNGGDSGGEMCQQHDGEPAVPPGQLYSSQPSVYFAVGGSEGSVSRCTPSPQSQGSASPPQAVTNPHVVMLHIVDGESIQFQRGDTVELIQGPATVQMVSSNPSPPMAYPVQVPPGHMMQQVVDGTGTLRHVILSPEPRVMTSMPPYSTSQPPPPFYPPPLQGYAPPYPPHPLFSPSQACVMSTGASMSQPPGHTSSSPSHPCYNRDDRSRQRADRLRRKLDERHQRQPAASSRSSPSQSPCPGPGGAVIVEHKNGVGSAPAGSVASDGDQNGEVASGGSSSPVSGSQADEEERAVIEFLSKLKPPQVTEITSVSALVSWSHPEVTVENLNIPPSQLSYLLLMAEQRRSGSMPPASAYRRVVSDCTCAHPLTDLRPGTTYCLILQGSLDGLQGSKTPTVSFTTQAAAPSTPLPPTLQNKTKTSLLVRWSAPHDNGSRVSLYVLQCDDGSGYSEVFRGKSKQHNVTHLQAATAYRLRISAVNEVGQSPFSEPVSLQTSGSAPVQPLPPELHGATSSSLSVGWQRRPCDDSFQLQMEQEGSQYGFRALHSGPETSFTATNLGRNTVYRFKLRAVNEEGASRWSEPVGFRTQCEPPGAPGKPHVRGRIHSHQFRLRWEPPQDTGGAAVTAYRLEMDSGAGMQQVYCGTELEFTVVNLDPGTTYQLQVRSMGEGGVSTPSDPAVVTTEPVCPGRCAPPRLHGKPRANSCHLKWGYPEYSGGPLTSLVTRFELDMTQPDNTTNRVYSGQDTECTVSSLLPGRPYLVQVRAVNRVGAGPWSEALQFVSGAGPPDPPGPPHVSARSPHVLLVSWRPPANNGAAISEYRLESGGQQLYLGPGLQHEARALQPATAYRFRVSAANPTGWGPASEPTLCVTPAASPAAVRQVEAEPSATALSLSWSPPQDHGAEILHYTVELSDRLISTPGPETQLTVSDLGPDTVYRIRVQAVNSVGAGPFSVVRKFSTLSLPPPPPPLELTHTAHNFVRLRWADPKQQTDMIVYTLECEAKNGEFYVVYSGSGTQFKVARLAEDTEYRFRICAANEAGDGPYSNVLSCRTTRQPPPTVRGLRVTERTERVCTLEWNPAKSVGGPITYRLQLLLHTRDTDFKTIYSGPETGFRLGGLEPQHDYQARVCCVTPGGGAGPYTAVLRFSTPASPPPPPAVRPQHQPAAQVEKKPWTEQQWAMAILCAFTVFALFLALVVQQIMLVFS